MIPAERQVVVTVKWAHPAETPALLEPRTLSLIENADDEPLGHIIREFVRQLPGCPILVTGRLNDPGVEAGHGGARIRRQGNAGSTG